MCCVKTSKYENQNDQLNIKENNCYIPECWVNNNIPDCKSQNHLKKN